VEGSSYQECPRIGGRLTELASNESDEAVVTAAHIHGRGREEDATGANTQHDRNTAMSCFTYAIGVSIGKVARQSPTTTCTSPRAPSSTMTGSSRALG
jgi:hypothetical protein